MPIVATAPCREKAVIAFGDIPVGGKRGARLAQHPNAHYHRVSATSGESALGAIKAFKADMAYQNRSIGHLGTSWSYKTSQCESYFVSAPKG